MFHIRNEATLEETVAHELGNPFRILDIGFPFGHLLQFSRIDDSHLAERCQYIEHRLPVYPRTFHRHVGDSQAGQPSGQRFQTCQRSREGLDKALDLAFVGWTRIHKRRPSFCVRPGQRSVRTRLPSCCLLRPPWHTLFKDTGCPACLPPLQEGSTSRGRSRYANLIRLRARMLLAPRGITISLTDGRSTSLPHVFHAPWCPRSA